MFSNRAGFLLIEGMISLLIMSMTWVFLIMMESYCIHTHYDAVHYGQALIQASAFIEAMQAQKKLPVDRNVHGKEQPYTITWALENAQQFPLDLPESNNKTINWKQVCVTVSWESFDQEAKKICIRAGVIVDENS